MADEKRKENLKKWKPGESGNPKGRAKGKYGSLTQALRHMIQETDPDDKQGRPYVEVLSSVMLWHGAHGFNGKGSPSTIEKIANRLDGKPAETVTLNATIAQKSPEEHAQEIFETLQRLKRNEDSGDIRIN